MNLYDGKGNLIPVSGSTVEPMMGDVPRVYFTGEKPTGKNNVSAKMRYVSSTKDFEAYVLIKKQGSSSLQYPKANYTIAMYQDEAHAYKKKVNMRGWGEQSKFCLKANWVDLTHARNIVSAQLWSDIVASRSDYTEHPERLRKSPNNGAVDGFPIRVWYNGVYDGRYTWNIPKDAWMFYMDDSLDTHCVLCGESNTDAGTVFREETAINGSDWKDEIHDTCPLAIVTRWNEVINFVKDSTDDVFRKNLSNYINVNSAIDYFIFAYANGGIDSLGKNQLYVTYDGNLWYASAYDLDETWGNGNRGVVNVSSSVAMQDGYNVVTLGKQTNLLYERLASLFATEITARYAELREGALSEMNINNRFEAFADIVPSSIIAEDYASTTGGGEFTEMPGQETNNIQQIRQFIVDRLAYVDGILGG